MFYGGKRWDTAKSLNIYSDGNFSDSGVDYYLFVVDAQTTLTGLEDGEDWILKAGEGIVIQQRWTRVQGPGYKPVGFTIEDALEHFVEPGDDHPERCYEAIQMIGEHFPDRAREFIDSYRVELRDLRNSSKSKFDLDAELEND